MTAIHFDATPPSTLSHPPRQHRSRLHAALMSVLAAGAFASLPACDSDADDHDDDHSHAEILGEFTDDYGGSHVIDDTSWTQSYEGSEPAVYEVTQIDDDADFLLAENGSGTYDPGLWSRFDWTVFEGQLYYCQTAYAAVSEQDAADTPRADDTDPAAGGCGGMFPWTALTPG